MTDIDLFIGHFIDSNSGELPVGISHAGNYYQLKVRSILEIRHSISLVYGDQDFSETSEDRLHYMILKHGRHFSNFFSIVRNLFSLSRFIKQGSSILFYNLSIYDLFYFAYALQKKAKIVVLLTDAEFLQSGTLKDRFISKFLSHAHGILSLREIPALKRLDSKIEIMPGIVSQVEGKVVSQKKAGYVLLSGSLGITNGLVLALDFFSDQSCLQLIITGVPYLMTHPEFERLLEKYACPQIRYLGKLDYPEYLKVLTSCEYCLSLREPGEPGHQYNFPSKILEYMSYGILVISSLKYPELDDETYFVTEYSKEGLQACFEKVANLPAGQRGDMSRKAWNYVTVHCSHDVFERKIDSLYGT